MAGISKEVAEHNLRQASSASLAWVNH